MNIHATILCFLICSTALVTAQAQTLRGAHKSVSESGELVILNKRLEEDCQRGDSAEAERPMEKLQKEAISNQAPEYLVLIKGQLSDPISQAAISREDFVLRTNRRASDIIRRLPGLFLGGPTGEDKDVRLRGLDKEFSRVQVDGIQLPDGGEKREFQVNRIPSFIVQSVSVLRSPTAEYESDGIAGRVDIKTRPIPEKPTIEGRLGFGGRNQIDSSLFNGSLAYGHKPAGWFGYLAAFDRLNNTFERGREKRFSTGRAESEDERDRQLSTNLLLDFGFFYRTGEFHIKPMLLDLHSDKFKSRLNLDLKGSTGREDESEDKLQRTWGLSLTHRQVFPNGLWIQSSGGYFRTSEEKDKTKRTLKPAKDDFELDKTTLELEEKVDETWNLATTITLPFSLVRRQELKFGGALRLRERYRDKTATEINKAGLRKDITKPKDDFTLSEDYYASFIQSTLNLSEHISFTPGLRLEHVRLNSFSGTEKTSENTALADRTDLNPSFHLLYRARPDLSLRASLTRTVNRPKFDELSPYEQEEGGKIKTGNPMLKPARAWNLDVGVDYARENIFLSGNLFYKRIKDLIEEVDTGIDKDNKDVFRFNNIGNGKLKGLELEQRIGLGITRIKMLRAAVVWANQTFLRSETTQILPSQLQQKRPFKDQPRFLANAGIDYSYEASGTGFSIAWNYIGERKEFKPSQDLKTTAATSSYDLAVRQRLFAEISLFAEIENLTNEATIERESFINKTSSQRTEKGGRTYLFGLAFRF